ncbi:NFX1-type zinc finger-containing protein 1-like [Gigantopelta aegis]|uniref:NFX1-type zinc finger-containing protein 1-like n=1 Tax=Gigantopelta aegis TaxID=1735272 RepID=UPI001B88CACC|nr:NFX1-type zinc finger-containing protein 1-like [Gigantopelta aegis]
MEEEGGHQQRLHRGAGTQVRVTQLTLNKLRDLSTRDASQIVMSLSRSNGGLDNILKDVSMDADTTTLTLEVLGKACQCESMPEQVNEILSLVLQSPFIESILYGFLAQISFGTDRTHKERIIRHCVPLLKQLLVKMPTESMKQVQLVTVLVQKIWSDTSMVDENLNQDMCSITNVLTRTRPPEIRSAGRGAQYSVHSEGDQPPEDFRELSIYPAKQELLVDGPQRLFFRRNNVAERYDNLEHYLDVQFRLLRADYIIPLQESIAAFQTQLGDESRKSSPLRSHVYYNVHIVRPVCTHNGLCYRLSFELPPSTRVNWATSRRLMFGSLLCLSSDRFVDHFMFATVDQREKKDLKFGIVDVLFERESVLISDLPRDMRFTMVESSAYFEAYKHVLEGMKRLNDRNVPFQQYIVRCESDIRLPRYLQERPNPRYDLRPLIDENYCLRDDDDMQLFRQEFSDKASVAAAVELNNPSKWPSADTFHLDDSQWRALQNALTKEFALIQGPPGTGKTYLGLKIMKALLHNQNIWNTGENLPILVVCYTNHALDQFLEGIMKFFKGMLIRVGSRSKSDSSILQECNLRTARQRARDTRSVPLEVHANKVEIMKTMTALKGDIHGIATKLEVAEREIVHERCLTEYMTTEQESFFPVDQVYSLSSKSCIISDWLGISKDMQWIDNLQEKKPPEEEDNSVDEEVINVVSLAETAQSLRLLEVDDLDELSEFDDSANLDVDVIKVRMETMGFEVTKLDVSSETYLTGSVKAEWDEKQRRKRILKRGFARKIDSVDRMPEAEASRIDNIWHMRYKDRWRLYRYWVDCLCRQARGQIRDKEKQYHRVCARYKESLLQEDKMILKRARIVGMTTTAAARYQSIMQEIGPKIVIVEEAAEVLEAHVISTLSRGCEHLILIGDHKQLRPNPTVHKLARDFNLEISLFERMVYCKLHWDCLKWQHRMRPEISRVMKAIYPELEDDESVKSFPDVRGVSQNIAFIEHEYLHEIDGETLSCVNMQEAEYVVSLCEYLLKQGYSQSQITIISMYSAQINVIRLLMPKSRFEGVRIASVDSFQGEENDIILVSLVRSAEVGESIGFLKTDNRICVALSRAKHGMYVLGNFRFLTDKSDLLLNIITQARNEKYLSHSLQLVCPRHRTGKGIEAKEPRDFTRAPEGGCLKPCDNRLPCGHACKKTCHSGSHSVCYMPCGKKCENGHPCDSLCFHCSRGCPPCKKPVQKLLPKCNHVQMVPCSMEPWLFKCTHKVEEDRSCGHHISVECSGRKIMPCTNPCSQVLPCGDLCSGTCGTCFQGRLNQPCQLRCRKILVCGHACLDQCGNCPPCQKDCENRCHHTMCQEKCGDPCVPCRMPCPWSCRHKRCTRLCSEACDRDRCDERCRKQLSCGHPCIGLCGEPCPRLCRICDGDHETFKLWLGNEDDPNARFVELQDCSHIIEVTSLDHWMDDVRGPEEEDEDEKLKCDDLDKAKKSDDDEAKTAVLLKVCPRCKTPIRRNLRYGSVINETLNSIEAVKRKIIGNEQRIRELSTSVDRATCMAVAPDRPAIEALTGHMVVKSEAVLAAQLNQVRIFLQVARMERKVSDARRQWSGSADSFSPIARDLDAFRSWILQFRTVFGEQEIIDANRELRRLSLLLYFLKSREVIHDDLQEAVPAHLMRRLGSVIKDLEQCTVITEDSLDEAESVKDELVEYVPETRIGITEDERLMIVHTMDMKQGQWWRCGKGHVYTVGECGRPTERARCPECRAEIGGENHAFVENNSWAPEMDDAQEQPWSEEQDYMLALQMQFGR